MLPDLPILDSITRLYIQRWNVKAIWSPSTASGRAPWLWLSMGLTTNVGPLQSHQQSSWQSEPRPVTVELCQRTERRVSSSYSHGRCSKKILRAAEPKDKPILANRNPRHETSLRFAALWANSSVSQSVNCILNTPKEHRKGNCSMASITHICITLKLS